MIRTKYIARLAPALALVVAAFGIAACNGGAEREGERVNREVRDDVRGMRDFLGSRGITVNTMLPER